MAAYLELHIEQGPVLLDLDLPLGTVLGTLVSSATPSRFAQAAHSGSTPMNGVATFRRGKMTRDLSDRGTQHVAFARLVRAQRNQASSPVWSRKAIALDQRHLDANVLARMLQEAKEASERFAKEGNVSVRWKRLWEIEPILFNKDLIKFCDEAISETGAKPHRLPSGPLHDAAEVARAGVPTVMMFVQSLHGISHNKIEDTKEEHLERAVTALDKLADKAMSWILSK